MQDSTSRANNSEPGNSKKNAIGDKEHIAPPGGETKIRSGSSAETTSTDEFRCVATMPRQQRAHPAPNAAANDDMGLAQNGQATAMTLWQPRSHFSTHQPSALAGVSNATRPPNCCVAGRTTGSGRCSYGVSSPCSKLLPAAQQSAATATVTIPPSSTRTVHFRNQSQQQIQLRHSMTLPRNHFVSQQAATIASHAATSAAASVGAPPPPPPPVRRSTVSVDCGGEMAARLKPPPPPSTTMAAMLQSGNRSTDFAAGYQPKLPYQTSADRQKSGGFYLTTGSSTGSSVSAPGGTTVGQQGGVLMNRQHTISTIIV
jgi:hypothetical protein